MFSGVVTGDIKSLIETNTRVSLKPTRQESEDMIHNQLAAFERLLLHAMSRFSKENLYYTLNHVTRWAQNEYHETNQNRLPTNFKFQSIQQLKECMISMKEKRVNKSSEDEYVFKYYDLFMNDLLYLKDLKKYFDDEIYKSLINYHYEPSLGKNKSELKTSSPLLKDKRRSASCDTDEDYSGYRSRVESSRNKNRHQKDKDVMKGDTNATDAEKRYRETVGKLQDILKQWDGLLSESYLDLNNFDPDSYHELMQFTNYSQFEPILRLVPDIFTKCYKCIDLAKLWLRESDIVLKDIPLPDLTINTADENENNNNTNSYNEQITTPREFDKEVRDINIQISDIEKVIEADERQLKEYKREMSHLTNRDNRFSELSSKFVKLDAKLVFATGDFHKSKMEQYAIANKVKCCPNDSDNYKALKEKLKKIDKEVSEKHWKMKLLEFEKAMIEEDYAVESGIRPSFIRFIGDTNDKMHELQEAVQAKKVEKLKLKKQLALLKTNTDRMKYMRTYIGSNETKNRESMDRESTLSSGVSEAEIKDSSEDMLEDWNETDEDSVGPDLSSSRYEAVEAKQSRLVSKRIQVAGNENTKTREKGSSRYETVNSP